MGAFLWCGCGGEVMEVVGGAVFFFFFFLSCFFFFFFFFFFLFFLIVPFLSGCFVPIFPLPAWCLNWTHRTE